MNAYELLAAIILVLAVLSLVVYVPALIVGGRAEVREQAFKAHADDVLNAHKADVRHRGHVANATGTRWQS